MYSRNFLSCSADVESGSAVLLADCRKNIDSWEKETPSHLLYVRYYNVNIFSRASQTLLVSIHCGTR